MALQAIADEDDDADNSFWAQDFFAEEQRDDSYEESSAGEDVVDSDFDKAESSDSEQDGEDKLKKVKRTVGKREHLPGYKQAAQRAARKAAAVRARGSKDASGVVGKEGDAKGKRKAAPAHEDITAGDAEHGAYVHLQRIGFLCVLQHRECKRSAPRRG